MEYFDDYAELCKETKDIQAFENGGKVFIGESGVAIEQYLCVERNVSFHQWLVDNYKSHIKYTN